MQDSGDSTPEGAEDPGSNKPGQNSGQADAENSESNQPEKVFDFYHQHFGVALAAGSQEVRNAEAGGRAAYAARTEVADKSGAKSESWNALKSLIRYQTSTTAVPQKNELTSSGDSFEAQWFSKSSDDLPPAAKSESTGEHEAVRLKWIPIVDNVPEIIQPVVDNVPEIIRQQPQEAPEPIEEVAAEPQTSEQSYEELLAATARGETSAPETAKPIAKKFFGKPARMNRRPMPKPRVSVDNSYEEALAATARGEQPVEPVLETEIEILSPQPELGAARSEEEVDDDVSDHEVAEARSKFGSMNAFARMQKRTKEQVESKEEQSITGDIPDQVQDEVQAGNWDTKPASDATDEDSAKVLNQWCSTSTGESIPAVPSLDELNSIPTPSILKDIPTQPKPFSLSTPKPTAAETGEKEVTPDSVHQTARSSWLKAASEYSSSVIKAVTEQMKMISSKPKKTTPESPEFHTAELPDAPEDNS